MSDTQPEVKARRTLPWERRSYVKPMWRLPYGKWTDVQGRSVLFDRIYKPLWQRTPDGQVSPADPYEWVPYVKQEWFYNDGTPMPKRMKAIKAILREWGIDHA